MNDVLCRNAVVRSHQSDTVLHRIDQLQRRVLGFTVLQPILLQLGPVRPARVRVRVDGRTRHAQVNSLHLKRVLRKMTISSNPFVSLIRLYVFQSSRHLLSEHEREETVRQRLSQAQDAGGSAEMMFCRTRGRLILLQFAAGLVKRSLVGDNVMTYWYITFYSRFMRIYRRPLGMIWSGRKHQWSV